MESPAMPLATSDEQRVLSGALAEQRGHVFETIEGLDDRDLRRPVLPSGWTCLGLINHLSLDVERFWFQAVIAGEPGAVGEVLPPSGNAWEVSAAEPADAVLRRYRDNIARADAIIAAHALDQPPAWWPDFFGSYRLHSVREVVLHVVTETATHAGHLDAARELIDGKLHLVLTE
jgi:uncharacterized damage-inducible protein DinB